MAIFIGRDELVNRLKEAKRPEDKKGIEAEIEVGDVLGRFLPEDSYLIAQPEIGEKQPDFLTISPTYGFRLVEVKNLSIRYIDEVYSNGVLKTRYGNKNPYAQVKLHGVALKNYLLSNHRSIGLGDPFRYIGHAVIHVGFNKLEFEYKFNRQIKQWTSGDLDHYYKYHFFLEEIDQQIDGILAGATKFQSYPLKNYQIQDIVDKLTVSPQRKYNADDDVILDDYEQKLAHVSDEVIQLKEDMQSYKTQEDNSVKEKKKRFVYPILAMILALAIFSAVKISNNIDFANEEVTEGISHLVNSEGSAEERVQITATVDRFSYDSASGTKFLTLSDETGQIEAVIFDQIKVPFIEEGESYTFNGYLQLTRDNKEMEINITSLE